MPQHQQLDFLGAPSRASSVNICRNCRNTWYTSEPLMARDHQYEKRGSRRTTSHLNAPEPELRAAQAAFLIGDGA